MFIHNRMMLNSSLPNLKGFPLPQTVQKFQNNVRLELVDKVNKGSFPYTHINLEIFAIVQEDGETVYIPINELFLEEHPEYIGMSYNYNTQNTIRLDSVLTFQQVGSGETVQYTATYPLYQNFRLDYILFEVDYPSHITEKAIGGFYSSNTYNSNNKATAYFDIPQSWCQELRTNGYIDCRMTVGIAESTPCTYQNGLNPTEGYDSPVRIFTDIPFSYDNKTIGFHVTGYNPRSERYDVYISMNWNTSYDDSVNLLHKSNGKQGTIYAYHNIAINVVGGLFLNVSEYNNLPSSIPLRSSNVLTYAFGVGGTMLFEKNPKLVIINGQILGYDQHGLSNVDATILQRDAEINSIGGGLEMQIYYTASVAEYVYNVYQRKYFEWYS